MKWLNNIKTYFYQEECTPTCDKQDNGSAILQTPSPITMIKYKTNKVTETIFDSSMKYVNNDTAQCCIFGGSVIAGLMVNLYFPAGTTATIIQAGINTIFNVYANLMAGQVEANHPSVNSPEIKIREVVKLLKRSNPKLYREFTTKVTDLYSEKRQVPDIIKLIKEAQENTTEDRKELNHFVKNSVSQIDTTQEIIKEIIRKYNKKQEEKKHRDVEEIDGATRVPRRRERNFKLHSINL